MGFNLGHALEVFFSRVISTSLLDLFENDRERTRLVRILTSKFRIPIFRIPVSKLDSGCKVMDFGSVVKDSGFKAKQKVGWIS